MYDLPQRTTIAWPPAPVTQFYFIFFDRSQLHCLQIGTRSFCRQGRHRPGGWRTGSACVRCRSPPRLSKAPWAR